LLFRFMLCLQSIANVPLPGEHIPRPPHSRSPRAGSIFSMDQLQDEPDAHAVRAKIQNEPKPPVSH
jgi:hypothetical protein